MTRCRDCRKEKPDELMAKSYGKVQTLCRACSAERSRKRGHLIEDGEDAPMPTMPQGHPPAYQIERDPGPFETSLPRGALFYAQEFREMVQNGYLNDGLIARRFDGRIIRVEGRKAVEL